MQILYGQIHIHMDLAFPHKHLVEEVKVQLQCELWPETNLLLVKL